MKTKEEIVKNLDTLTKKVKKKQLSAFDYVQKVNEELEHLDKDKLSIKEKLLIASYEKLANTFKTVGSIMSKYGINKFRR